MDTPAVKHILAGLKKRDLSLALNRGGDGLKLKGRQSAITERVKLVLKEAKPALVAYLCEQDQQRQGEQAETQAKRRAA
ncbi:MAG: hypothetical protein V4671_30555, partial [Armatimonadota bacterium]